MKKICLIFRVHLSPTLRPYRFFEIGDHAPYYEEETLAADILQEAQTCLQPVSQLLLRQIQSNREKIRVAIFLSGMTAALLEKYAPGLTPVFRQLANTGCVEFLSGTYSWSLASLYHPAAFQRQIADHRQSMQELTGAGTSGIFLNTGLIYNHQIGRQLRQAGMQGAILEGNKQLLGWKSPDALYADSRIPGMKLFLNNPDLNKDFLHLLTGSQKIQRPGHKGSVQDEILSAGDTDQQVNLFVPFEILRQPEGHSSGNLQMLEYFLYKAGQSSGIQYCTPSDLLHSGVIPEALQTDLYLLPEEKNNFLMYEPGNELQQEALTKLYEMTGKMELIADPEVWQEWNFLQSAVHPGHMATNCPDGTHSGTNNPFPSPFDAFIIYMNILNDFNLKLEQLAKK